MSDDEAKFDVRVRERLVQSGHLKESEITKHLEALRDVADQAVTVVAKQPALQSESDRDIVIVRTSGVRPPPAIPRLDDLESTPIDDELDDELDDDDDDEDETTVVKKAPAPEKPPAAAAVEKSDDVDDELDKADKAEKAEAEKTEGESGGEEKKDVDDEWGDSTT